jgi:hypothetical protein
MHKNKSLWMSRATVLEKAHHLNILVYHCDILSKETIKQSNKETETFSFNRLEQSRKKVELYFWIETKRTIFERTLKAKRIY